CHTDRPSEGKCRNEALLQCEESHHLPEETPRACKAFDLSVPLPAPAYRNRMCERPVNPSVRCCKLQSSPSRIGRWTSLQFSFPFQKRAGLASVPSGHKRNSHLTRLSLCYS